MLAVPFWVGATIRVRAGDGLPAGVWTLLACWVLGYFAFNAFSLLLKAVPARRGRYVRPTVAYVAASVAFGVATLAFDGPGLLRWVPVFATLLAPALILAAQRQERATLGGALTTGAAALLVLVVPFPDPAALLPWTPLVRSSVALALLTFGYFFGTVLYVKTNIRERGNAAFYAASVGWHLAAMLGSGFAAAAGLASPVWVVLFVAANARAAIVPLRRPPLTPKRIGLIEVGFCAALCLITALGSG